jgi:hypothetical protein
MSNETVREVLPPDAEGEVVAVAAPAANEFAVEALPVPVFSSGWDVRVVQPVNPGWLAVAIHLDGQRSEVAQAETMDEALRMLSDAARRSDDAYKGES